MRRGVEAEDNAAEKEKHGPCLTPATRTTGTGDVLPNDHRFVMEIPVPIKVKQGLAIYFFSTLLFELLFNQSLTH